MQQKTNKAQPLKDSGERRTSETGAQRDRAAGKGAFDLLPPTAMVRLAQHFEAGANKYERRNWEKGLPLSFYLDAALRHTFKLSAGFTDEPHAEAAAWNMMCFIETSARIAAGLLPQQLDDTPKTYAGLQPENCEW